MEIQTLMTILATIALAGGVGVVVRLYNALVKKPERVRAVLRKQGISGPPPTFVLGNILEIKKAMSTPPKSTTSDHQNKTTDSDQAAQISHIYDANILPFFVNWRQKYGTPLICYHLVYQHSLIPCLIY